MISRQRICSLGVVLLAMVTPVIGLGAVAAMGAYLPEARGKAEVIDACTGCHSLESFTQQRHTVAEWDEIITDMEFEGAYLSEQERALVHQYLAANLGPGDSPFALGGTRLANGNGALQGQGLVAEKLAAASRRSLDCTAQEVDGACRSGRAFRDAPAAPEMVILPGGRFAMGAAPGDPMSVAREAPRHDVTLGRFAMGRYAVTLDEWNACVEDGGCKRYPWVDSQGTGRRPVTKIDWQDAKSYVAWLSRLTGVGYRLPTEAEWEYAARDGRDEPVLGFAVLEPSAANFASDAIREVGAYPANGFGLHDMFGNVWEWTEDCWKDNYEGAHDDGAPWLGGACKFRSVRGGAWYSVGLSLRPTGRFSSPAGNRNKGVGFRVARSLD